MFFGKVIFAGTCWFCAVIFFAMALWAKKRKTPMHFWSGSTVQPEEIKDIPAYNRANAIMWSIYGFCFIISGIAGLVNIMTGTVLLMALCLPGIVVLILAYRHIYKRYSDSSFIKEGPRIKSRAYKIVIAGTIAITILIFIAVGVLFYHGEKEPEINIFDNSMQINALYGLRLNFSDIKSVSLIHDSMNGMGAGVRTNGYSSFSQTLKGHFYSEELGQTLLFVQGNISPVIRIERFDKKDIYLNFKDSDKTERLYLELRRQTSQ